MSDEVPIGPGNPSGEYGGDGLRSLPSSTGSVALAEMTLTAPGLWMRFKATPERVRRVMEFVLKEANESELKADSSDSAQKTP